MRGHPGCLLQCTGGGIRILLVSAHEVVVSQILLDSAEPRDAGTSWLSSPVHRRGYQDPLSICTVSRTRNEPKLSNSARLDYCSWIDDDNTTRR